ncbi:MAG: serine hydrolase [Candidatus Krumholzibacteriota bacterium]|nr:serine hydrolase [Candidatus Krumholzibacteriota bacterium]
MSTFRSDAALLLSTILVGALAVSCSPDYRAVFPADLVGDYLFDCRDHDAVFLVHVEEAAGSLVALFDLADDPIPLERVAPGSHLFRMRGEWIGEYELAFERGEGDGIETLVMTRNGGDIVMRGERTTEPAATLRSYRGEMPSPYRYRQPIECGDGWRTSDIRNSGIDVAAIENLVNELAGNHPWMHSILVVRNGRIVLEEYLNNCDPLRLHRVQSVTKSVTSALVGLALREGCIRDIDDPVYRYLPGYDSLFIGDKRNVTIRHLLTMSAGFEWNEGSTYHADPERCDSHIAGATGDYIGYVLAKPLATKPGATWCYNSGYPNILGHIIERTCGMSIVEFSYRYLLDPIGVKRFQLFDIAGEDRPSCAGGCRMTSRDMARFGQLYLDGGRWKGRQVVPAAWVAESMTPRYETPHGTGYGYCWKTMTSPDGKHEFFFASGTGGQYIVCIPDLDTVVVTTARFDTDRGDAIAGVLLEKLLPAL